MLSNGQKIEIQNAFFCSVIHTILLLPNMQSPTSKAIENSYIEIHEKEMSIFPETIQSFQSTDSFGILYLKMAKVNIIQKPLFLLFSIDTSASMEEIVDFQKKTTKMDYLIHTFQHILRFLAEKNIPIVIRVHSFHNQVDIILENTQLSKENVDKICEKMQALEPDGITDIGLALSIAEMELSKYKESHPNHQIIHMFMTDGEPTSGIRDTKRLTEMVNPNVKNIFFGFGNDHNAYLLRKFSQKKNADYQFIDTVENTGMIFGETLHRFLYPALESVKFSIENGSFYDWRTNQWVDFLEETVIMGESEKTYHIRTNQPDIVNVKVFGIDYSLYDSLTDSFTETLLDVVHSLPSLVPLEETPIKTDLTKYMFRQKVQEMLYTVTSYIELCETKQKKVAKERNMETKKIKIELKCLFRKIHKYMREENLLNDPFMKLLCDDIYVTYQNLDSRYAYMYTVARQTSQGNQQCYSTHSTFSEEDSDVNNMSFTLPKYVRKNTTHFSFEDEDINDSMSSPFQNLREDPMEDTGYLSNDELETYHSDNLNTTCYAIPSCIDTMRYMSQSISFHQK